MLRHPEPDPWDLDDEDERVTCAREVDIGDPEEDAEAGATGNLADDALTRRLRRARRHLDGHHCQRFARDLKRVRVQLGVDDEPASISADEEDPARGAGGGSFASEPTAPRTIRDLECELLCAETKAKLKIETPPVCVDEYVVHRRLGGGGMGVVWLASDSRIKRMVALKILRRMPERGQTAALVASSWNEGTAMALVQHPNIASIYTLGEIGGQPYLVMEYVDGCTLTRWRVDNEPSEAILLRIYAEIARGLGAVHRVDCVHADFKPDNVLVTREGVPKVVDFGMATGAGLDALGGTPEYMALEQLDEHAPNATVKSDQYAFCVALFEDLLGAHPYVGQSYDQFAQTIRESKPTTPPDEVRRAFITKISENLRSGRLYWPERLRRLPRWLRSALERGLDPDPARRYDSMESLAEVLERPQRLAAHCRNGSFVGAAALVGAALVAGGVMVLKTGPCEAPEAAFEAIWNDTVVATLPADVRGPARALLDPYQAAWTRTRVEVCEATFVRNEVSGETHDARIACLDRRLDAARTAIAALGRGQVERLHGALASPSTCDLVDRPTREPPPGTADAVQHAFARLEDEVFAAELAEDYEVGQAKAETLVDEALTIGYEPLIAASLYHRGRIILARLVNQGTIDHDAELRAHGERSLADAIVHAGRSGDALYLDALVFRMRYDGVVGGDFSAEDERLLAATVPLNRLDAVAQAVVKDARALLSFRRAVALPAEELPAALAPAIALYREALDAYHGGGDRFAEAKALENLGQVLYHAGEPVAALQSYREALEIWREMYGPKSSYLGVIYPRMIQAFVDSDDAAAVTLCDEVQEWIAEQRGLPRWARSAAKVDLACASATYDDEPRALEYALHAVAGPLPKNEMLGALLVASGLRLRVNGRAEASLIQAAELLDRADRLVEAEGPHPLLLDAYRGRLHLRRGEFPEAADRSAAAREQLESEGTTPLEAAELLVDLAEARRGADQPHDPSLLIEAALTVQAASDADPRDHDLPHLRQRLTALQTFH